MLGLAAVGVDDQDVVLLSAGVSSKAASSQMRDLVAAGVFQGVRQVQCLVAVTMVLALAAGEDQDLGPVGDLLLGQAGEAARNARVRAAPRTGRVRTGATPEGRGRGRRAEGFDPHGCSVRIDRRKTPRRPQAVGRAKRTRDAMIMIHRFLTVGLVAALVGVAVAADDAPRPQGRRAQLQGPGLVEEGNPEVADARRLQIRSPPPRATTSRPS